MVESAVGVLTILLLIIVIVAVVYVFILTLELEHLFESVRNAFVTVATWRPKSGIDKEIAEEEKEIAELERQKEKMDRLAELKLRKERLFEEAHEGDEWTDEDESYHCYRCDRFIVGLDNFYKHHKKWHK